MAKDKIAPEKEIRIAELRAVDLPEEGEEGLMILEGYAIVFDSPATHYGFTESIARGALDGADLSDVPMRYNHNDTWLVIARTRNNSLTLTVDEKGLFVRAVLIDTQANEDIHKSVQAKLIDKMSFAFSTEADEWDYETDTRVVTKIRKLYDVSVVDTPFYSETEIYARAIGELESHKGELESRKRDALELEKLKTQILRKA